MTVPQDGLLINDSSILLIDYMHTPGEEIVFSCKPGFVPQTVMKTVCEENGMWNPDPKEVLCFEGA